MIGIGVINLCWIIGLRSPRGIEYKLEIVYEKEVKGYFHKISRSIIDYYIKINIGTLVIGYNEGWKQNSNMGKSNNQNFVSIPFLKLIKQIQSIFILLINY